MPFDVDLARVCAHTALADSPERWQHAQAAARRAEEIAAVAGPIDREVLVCSAWLHDVGHGVMARRTGFVPVDGALHLRAKGWPERVVALVAHHAEARMLAPLKGAEELLAQFAREDGPVADALVYADLLVGLDGCRISLSQRISRMDSAYDDASAADRVLWERRRQALLQAVARTEQRLVGLRRARVGSGGED